MIAPLKFFAAACNLDQTFFGLPVWYKYVPTSTVNNQCRINVDFSGHPEHIWLVVLGITDILLRLGGMIAVGYIIWGGFLYMSSQGEPDRTKRAKDTILGAVAGLVLILIAIPVVSFVGNRF